MKGGPIIKDHWTISELADELEVTRRTIRYHLQQIGGGQEKNASGMIIISADERQALLLRIKGEEIKEDISRKMDTKNERIKKLNEAVHYLKQLLEAEKISTQQKTQELDRLTSILEEKDQQLAQYKQQQQFLQEQLTSQLQLLDQEQQLHLHTKSELDRSRQSQLALEEEIQSKDDRSWWQRLFLP